MLKLKIEKRWSLFSSFCVWQNKIPLSTGETDAIQIQVTTCGVFSSFYVVGSKQFMLVNCTSVVN